MKQIKHNLTTSNLMLLPFGLSIHDDIVVGEIGEFYNGKAKIVSVSEVSVNAASTDTLSLGIYGLPISVVMGKMIDNWGDRIWKDKLILIALKK